MPTNTLLILTIATIAIISPGPDFVMVSRYALVTSRRTALACVAGICTGVAVHALYCTLGVAGILADFGFQELARLGGGLFLAWMGYKIVAGRGAGGTVSSRAQDAADPLGAFAKGLVNNLLNPKIVIFLIALFTQVIDARTGFLERLYYGGLITFHAVVYWTGLVFLLRVPTVKQLFTRNSGAVDLVAGSALVVFGMALLLEAA